MSSSKKDAVNKSDSEIAPLAAGQNTQKGKSETPTHKRAGKHKENQPKKKRSKTNNNNKKDAVSILLEDSEPEISSPKSTAQTKKKNKSSDYKYAATTKIGTSTIKGESKMNEKNFILKMSDLLQDLERLKAKNGAELEKHSFVHISEMNRLHILLTDLLYTQYFMRFPEEGAVPTKDRRLWKARRTLFLYARESRV